MARYLTESDLRAGGNEDIQRWINSAFLLDIKQDHVEFQQLLKQLKADICPERPQSPKFLAESLARLRDELETYFSLEEFYGCFDHATVGDSRIARLVRELKNEHETLFVRLNNLVELAEQVWYHETTEERVQQIVKEFTEFQADLEKHEKTELDLVSRQSVLDIGVGD